MKDIQNMMKNAADMLYYKKIIRGGMRHDENFNCG
jgi:hypothetical protein